MNITVLFLVYALIATSKCCYTYNVSSICSSKMMSNIGTFILKLCHFRHYIDKFIMFDEVYGRGYDLEKSTFSNAKSWDFLSTNIPFFECPDKVS